MNQSTLLGSVICRSAIALGILFLAGAQSVSAATSVEQTLSLSPGWNIVSTPRVLESHAFSIPETLSNFAIYTLDPSRASGWSTMADLGQTEFAPLYGYFINNKSTTSQTLYFRYKASTTPNERLFDRSFATSGWYAIGVANPTYADRQLEVIVDENNPSQVFGSILDSTDLVVDFTDVHAQDIASSVALNDPWRAAVASDVNALADIRDTKGYAIYINKPGTHYIGFQNESDDGGSAAMATIAFNTNTLPLSSSNVDPQADYVVWQNSVSVGSRDALLSSIRFRQLGSVSTSDLKNFRLMVDGTQVGTAVESVNSNQYVEFTFATPVTMKAGTRVVKLVADIVGGSNKTFAFSVQQSVDATFWDSQLNVVIAPTSFSAVTSATQTVNQGTLTITKATDSPSGNVVLQGTGVTLAKFTVKAAGEKLKIENLKVGFTTAGTLFYSAAKIRNGALFANGVQIGSTQDITLASGTPTQYNLGSSLMVEPGLDVVLEIRGDVYNNNGTQFAANDTIIARVVAGTNNVYKMSSYGYIGNSAVSGNPLVITSGSVAVIKATSYVNQTVVVPVTAFKIAEFNVTTGSTEALNLNQFTLIFSGSNYTAAQLQDVYITYGAKQTTVKATVASSSNTFSINENVPANTTMSVKVYATLNAGIATGAVVTTAVVVDATSQASGNAATGSATGQSMTVNTGSLSVATDASTPVSAIVVGGTMPMVGAFKFTASNDAFTIVDLSVVASSSDSIIELVFKDGNTELGRQSFNGLTLTKLGLNLVVPMNNSKVITIYANLGSVGTNAAAAGANIRVALTGVKQRDSNGVETNPSMFVQANPMYVYKTKPTITNVALPTTILTAGTQTVAQFTVTADAAGTVAWRQIKLNIASSTPSGVVTTSGYAIYDSANQSTPLANVTVVQTATGVTFTSSQDQEVSGSKTYVVKALVGGTGVVSGASLSHNIPTVATAQTSPVAYASVPSSSSFVWSDESVVPHSATSADWSNDYLVKNLPTDSQTLTK